MAHVGGVRHCGKSSAAAEPLEFAWRRMPARAGRRHPSLHVDAAGPNFLAQEICGFVDAGEKNRVWEDLMGFPRHAHGGRPLFSAHEAWPGRRHQRRALKRYPFQARGRSPWRSTRTARWRHFKEGAGLPPCFWVGWRRGRRTHFPSAPILNPAALYAQCRLHGFQSSSAPCRSWGRTWPALVYCHPPGQGHGSLEFGIDLGMMR